MVRAGSIPKRAGKGDEEEQSWLRPRKRAGEGEGDEDEQSQLHPKKEWERERG